MAEGGCLLDTGASLRTARSLLVDASTRKSSCRHADQVLATVCCGILEFLVDPSHNKLLNCPGFSKSDKQAAFYPTPPDIMVAKLLRYTLARKLRLKQWRFLLPGTPESRNCSLPGVGAPFALAPRFSAEDDAAPRKAQRQLALGC